MHRYNSTTRIFNPPLLKWIGGKARQSNFIISLIPEHRRYLDVTLGGATVSLNKPKSKIEVLSDIDADLISFYNQIKENGPELARLAEMIRPSELTLHVAQRIDSDDPLYLALQFLVCNRMTFRAHGRGFEQNSQWDSVPKRILRAHKRLRKTAIEQADLFDQIKGARNQTFIFIDPPYLDQDYEMHTQIDHVRLLKAAVRSKAKILLCGNDSALYTEALWPAWQCIKRPFMITCGPMKRTITECYWTNYDAI